MIERNASSGGIKYHPLYNCFKIPPCFVIPCVSHWRMSLCHLSVVLTPTPCVLLDSLSLIMLYLIFLCLILVCWVNKTEENVDTDKKNIDFQD